MVFGKIHDTLGRYFKKKEDVNLTSGEIGKPLFLLALPLVITFLLQTAYNLADTFWLGQLSTEALAAISFAFPLVFLFISISSGVALTGSILVAQYEGAGKKSKVNYAASQAISFSILFSLAVAVLGIFIIEPVIGLMGAEPDVLALAVEYMNIIFGGMVFLFTFFTFSSLMRGWGDTVTPMLIMFGSVIMNIILDPFLIFGWSFFPELGIAGAAYATVFSRAAATVAGLYLLFSGRYDLQIKLSELMPEKKFFHRITSIGIPASLDQASRALGISVTMAIVGMFPTYIVAGFGIGSRVLSMVFLPAAAVAQATSTMTGQNIGAGKPERAEKAAKIAAKYSFVILSLLGVLTFVGAGWIGNIFSNDPRVIEAAANMLKVIAFTFGSMGVMRAFNGVFRGSGSTKLAMIVTVATIWVFRLPLTYGLSKVMGSYGIWLSFALANVFGALLAAYMFYNFDWKSSVLGQSETPELGIIESVKTRVDDFLASLQT